MSFPRSLASGKNFFLKNSCAIIGQNNNFPLVVTIQTYSSVVCIMEQVELSHPNAELRLLEVFYHKIYKVMTL